MSNIHHTAIIDSTAEIADSAIIGPYCIVGKEAKIGAGTEMMAHSQVLNYSELGEGNLISPMAVIGGAPQDHGYKGEPTRVVIGNNNVIREYVTINRGTMKQNQVTIVGDDNLFMAYTHLAHDCIVENNCIFTNMAQISGHCHVHNNVIFSGNVLAHQFVNFGERCFLAPNSIVRYDCLPGVIYEGNTAKARTLNMVGLKRAGYEGDAFKHIKQAFKLLCKSTLTLEEAVKQLEDESWNGEEFISKMLNSAKLMLETKGSRSGNLE